MTKTILTLVALATIGTAALAPTGASARARPAVHPVNRAHPAKVARPANVRTNFRRTIRLARPAWRHAPAVRGSVRFGYRPVWRRPVFAHPVGYPVYQAPVPYGAAAPAYQPAQPAMQAPVNGMNVVMVAVPNGQYSMTGNGQWIEQTSDGKTFQFTEANRDQASVTLNDASRGVELTLDLSQRKVFYADRNSPKRPLYPIVNASAK